MKGQIEERQHRIVDLVRVERHPRPVPDLLELRWRSWPHAYREPKPTVVEIVGEEEVSTPSERTVAP
jgi:hypothetical protein